MYFHFLKAEPFSLEDDERFDLGVFQWEATAENLESTPIHPDEP
jgi:hypothetical protein